MEHISLSELEQRTKDVILNMTVLTEGNKIGLPPIDDEGRYWMVLWTHILEEFAIRYGPYPAGFRDGLLADVRLPNSESPLAAKAAEIVSRKRLAPGSYLVKYGKLSRIREMREAGIIRVAPAASYDDPSLNPAVRDKELELYIQPPPSQMRIEVLDPKTRKIKSVFNPIGNKITISSSVDYYVYCLSSVLAPRLFLDFENDACAIILKAAKFIETLLAAFEQQVPGWRGVGLPVAYIDPLHARITQVDTFQQKHFRYSYQKEFRAIWLPDKPVSELPPVFLKLGSLSDYCEVLELTGT